MYDDLILRLRDAAKMSDALFVLLPHSEGNAVAKWYRDAADAIEELSRKYTEERNAAVELTGELASKPRWIPVTERLPEKHVFVLVHSKFVKMRTDFINNDGKWYTTPGVTHWMPLPEPPKEET